MKRLINGYPINHCYNISCFFCSMCPEKIEDCPKYKEKEKHRMKLTQKKSGKE